jgi:uncharacterized membrane protein
MEAIFYICATIDMPMTEKTIHNVFIISIFLKGLNAILEIALGILFSFNGAAVSLISFMIRGELIEDPTDFVATHIRAALPYLSSHVQLFGAFYLLSHGIIKIFLVWALLKNKLWAYPTAIVFLSLFIIYQVIQFGFNHSLVLVGLTIFDLLVLWLVVHEYRYIQGPKLAI